MIKEVLSNFETLIVLYAPVFLTYVTQAIDWCVTLKKFKSLDISKQLNPLLDRIDKLQNKLEDNKAEIDNLRQEKAEYDKCINELQNATQMVAESLKLQNELMNKIVQENVELKAELAREK